MYEIDFLPVESEGSDASNKSGDAIAIRFTSQLDRQWRVVLIDGGYQSAGQALVDHVKKHYKTDRVHLVISTHPDADHLNGLIVVLEQLKVDELLVHRPRLHASNVSDFSNLDALDKLIATAEGNGTTVVAEPFAGDTWFDGQLTVLGPSVEWYEKRLAAHLAGEEAGPSGNKMTKMFGSLLEHTLGYLPVETLTDRGETGPRNEASVVTLIEVDGRRLLFTGDVGMLGLTNAASEYEARIGSFEASPLTFFQAPHHGSRRNLGPTILNRILGPKGAPYATPTAFISAAKASEKHPSAKVVNALERRGCEVGTTEGWSICSQHGTESRNGWVTLEPLPPLDESGEDDD